MASVDATKAALGAAAMASAAIVGAAAWVWLSSGDALAACRIEGGGGVAGADIGGPFTLVAETGETVSEADVIAGPTLVYFGYTHCPDFCPRDAAIMADAADLLARDGVEVGLAFVTIDPGRDTPQTLAAFTDAMHPDMIGLTGPQDQVEAAARAYRVYFARAGDDPDYYLMDHSTFTYLMHPTQGLLDFYRTGSDPEKIAASVACYAEALG